MGNILAKLASAPLFTEPTASTDNTSAKSDDAAAAGKLGNPGNVDNLNQKCEDLQPQTFSGVKLNWHSDISDCLSATHSIHLGRGPNTRRGLFNRYHFDFKYMGFQAFDDGERYPLLMAEFEPCGSIFLSALQHVTKDLRCMIVTRIGSWQEISGQLTSEYRGQTFTSSMTAFNPNLFRNENRLIVNHLQSVTPRLALGFEVNALYDGIKLHSNWGICGRYAYGDSLLTGIIGPSGVNVCLWSQVLDVVQVGVDVVSCFERRDLKATFAYQIHVPHDGLRITSSIDNRGNIRGVVEKQLTLPPYGVILCVHVRNFRNRIFTGIALTVS